MNLALIGIIILLFGVVGLSLTGDIIKIVVTGGSQESIEKFGNDTKSIMSLGDSRINKGVDGIKNIDTKTGLSETEKLELIDTYKQDVIWGSIIMIVLIAFFVILIRFSFKFMNGGNEPPLGWLVVLSIAIVAVCAVLIGGATYPFSGWINLLLNWNSVAPTLLS